jgi:tRNA threonylcarbamoyladenosine biosynthesis protein TsaB
VLLLAIETTGPLASVAVADESGVVGEICSDQKMNHLKGLSSMIAELLDAEGLSLGDLDCVAASEGPGSFTGIRIGVSTARALAQVMGVSAIGVPTLASFAYHMPAFGGAVCPVFDARRGQVYSGIFCSGDDGGPIALVDGAARTPAELLLALEAVDWEKYDVSARKIRFFGDGLAACDDMLAEWRTAWASRIRTSVAPLDLRFQKASSVALLARHMIRGRCAASAARVRRAETEASGPSYACLLPVYMRKAEAERRLEEAQTQLPR